MVVVPDYLWWGAHFALAIALIVLVRRALRGGDGAGATIAGGVALLLAGVAVFAWIERHDAVVVEDDGAGSRGTRVYVIGEPKHPSQWVYSADPTWILNRSSRPIYLQLLERNASPAGPLLATKIAPGGVGVDSNVDGFGYVDERMPVSDRPRDGAVWLEWTRPAGEPPAP